MKNILRKEGGFTLIELLVVILIIGILIAVSAPSFLGQTKKAHESAAKQELATAYQNAKAYAVGDAGNNFSGYSQSNLNAGEPELVGKVTIGTVDASTVAATATDGSSTCSQTFTADNGPGTATC